MVDLQVWHAKLRDRVLRGDLTSPMDAPYLNVMAECFLFNEVEQATIPLWLQTHVLSIKFWTLQGLSKIASQRIKVELVLQGSWWRLILRKN